MDPSAPSQVLGPVGVIPVIVGSANTVMMSVAVFTQSLSSVNVYVTV